MCIMIYLCVKPLTMIVPRTVYPRQPKPQLLLMKLNVKPRKLNGQPIKLKSLQVVVTQAVVVVVAVEAVVVAVVVVAEVNPVLGSHMKFGNNFLLKPEPLSQVHNNARHPVNIDR